MSDIDLTEKAAGRIIWQYQNGVKFKAWIKLAPKIGTEQIQRAANQVVNMINVDTARGAQLDICGRIAGIANRPRVTSADLALFGYNGTPGAQAYGLAPYKNPNTPTVTAPIPDYLFRILVRAKIIKNTSMATVDDIKNAIDFILDDDSRVVDKLDMSFQVWLTKTPSTNLRYLIDNFDIIPRPQGVRLRFIERIYAHFGYAGTPTAVGYGQLPYFDFG